MDKKVPFPTRRSPRLAGYDYAQPAAYLVSVSVDQMEHRLGRVIDGVIHLNQAGDMVAACWHRLPERFPGIELDVCIVMPNHFHGIIFIGTEPSVEPPSLSRVIQAFKSESAMPYTRGVHAGHYPRYRRSLWHRSFHDKILLNEGAVDAARTYVLHNPRKWHEEQDRLGMDQTRADHLGR